MIQLFIFGLLLGFGACVPIGPINFEIIRRNLRFGTPVGISFGLGACLGDLAYLVLLSVGILQFLNHPVILKWIGILGALILAWFGYSALKLKTNIYESDTAAKKLPRKSLITHFTQGFLLTLVNPFTIVFWSSLSVMIAVKTKHIPHAIFYTGLGVMIATIIWVIGLNFVLDHTRHRLSPKVMHRINLIGGFILLVFAAWGIWHAF